jgi:DNA binding protein with HTH domain
VREYVFKTANASNLLCRWTQHRPERWILIQLLRGEARRKAEAALFTVHAPDEEADRFLKDEFGKRYGTYRVVNRRPGLVSVEVTNYLLPAYRGQDPVELATQLLGPDVFFAPILVHDGFIHVRVYATPPAEGRSFSELLRRITAAANPEEFQLVHAGEWDPLANLLPPAERITERQREVLRVAIEFGYYDEPRRCTLEEIARGLGVSKAAVHKHLVAAESRILKRHRL